MLLGAGGAARGAILPLLNAGPVSLTLANRSLDKATALAGDFALLGNVDVSGFSVLQGKFDVIINATSASLGNELPPVPAKAMSAVSATSPDTFFHT